ncbi:MAG: hypothetical protein ACUVUU_03420 [bacterium]
MEKLIGKNKRVAATVAVKWSAQHRIKGLCLMVLDQIAFGNFFWAQNAIGDCAGSPKMTKEKLAKSENCCCGSRTSSEASVCKECSNKGIPVKEITLQSLVKEKTLQTIKTLEGFYFCETPTCKVVYFNNDQISIYLKRKLRSGLA